MGDAPRDGDPVGVVRFLTSAQDTAGAVREGNKAVINEAELTKLYASLGLTPDAVKKVNPNRDVTTKVFAGDDIFIPGYYYIIRPGDILDRLREGTNITLSQLCWANRRKSGTTDPGASAWGRLQAPDLIRIPTTTVWNTNNVPARLKDGISFTNPPKGQYNN